MRNVVYLSDGVTEVANIVQGSFRWTEQTNTETDFRYGAACAGTIEFDCFGAQTDAIPEGEALTYVQEDGGIQTIIGVFYARPSIPSRNTFKVVAYDSISKLSADFSAWLAANQSAFPMTLAALVAQACSIAGVTFTGTFDMSSMSVQEFYADGLSCRQILSWAAEIGAYYVHANADGTVSFGRYAVSPTSIAPSAGTDAVAYKQGGLDYSNYDCDYIDGVAVKPIGVDGAAYMYPTTPAGDNLYLVTDNLLLNNADSTTLTAVAQNIYTDRVRIGAYTPCEAHIFRNENPFRAGDIVNFTDIQGFSGSFPVMQMEVTDGGATLKGTGNATYESNRGGGVTERLASLSENIVRIDKLKVNWADIDTAVINYLTSNNVTAQNLSIVDENGNVLATFDSTGIVLGESTQTHAELDFNSFELIDKDGNVYFSVGDLRNASGVVSVTNNFVGDGTQTAFVCRPGTVNNINTLVVTVNGTIKTINSDFLITVGVDYLVITFMTAPASGDAISAVYMSERPFYHYDNGTRASGSTSGYYSFIAGLNSEASALCSSVTGGRANVAGGNISHIGGGENNTTSDFGAVVGGGSGNTASGNLSAVGGGTGNAASGSESFVGGGDGNAASGIDSAIAGGHANRASGDISVVCGGRNNEASVTAAGVLCGLNNKANRAYSSVLGGRGNQATGQSQTVFGDYNLADNSMVEIVGNGTSNSNRSNARTLDWSGNETLAGDIFLQGGSFDVRSKINSKLDSGVETIAKADYLSDTSVFPGGITVSKQGNVIELYAGFNSSQKPTNGTYPGALADGYRPKATYAIFPIFSGTSPYLQSGSIWLYSTGTIEFYGVPNGGFIHGTYICQ